MSSSESKTGFETVGLIGLGMMGGSVAKDLRSRFPQTHIIGYDPSQQAINRALEEHLIDDVARPGDVGDMAGFIVIASPIDKVLPVAEEIASNVYPGPRLQVIDIASVKTEIVAGFEALTSESAEFTGTHPMAGTEFSGLEHARKDLFQGKPWMLCAHKENSPEGNAMVRRFISGMGAKLRETDPISHDRNVALVSHAVIMFSNLIFDFVATNYPEALDYAGDGFNSTTRLASGNPEMHYQIMSHNLGLVREYMGLFYEYLGDAMEGDKVPSLEFFMSNMGRRNSWLHKRR